MNAFDPVLITFGIYLIAMMLIGVVGYKLTKSFADYILGGRGLSSWVTAISAQAADFSGWILMGLPGAAYASGLGKSSLYICIFTAIGSMTNWKYIATRLRVYTELAKNSMTLSSFFSNRFRDHSGLLKLTTSVFTIVFFTLYCTAGFVSGGVLFESLFGIDRNTAILIGAFVIVFYTFLGGFLAVVYTEVIQGLIMFSTLIATAILGMIAVGGPEVVMDKIGTVNPDLLSALKTVDYSKESGSGTWLTSGSITFISVLSTVGWAIGYYGQPHILARFMAIKNHREMVKSRLIALTFGNVLPVYSTLFIGLMGIALYNGTNSLANPETVFIQMVRDSFNPWLGGFFLSAIMAAIMSTLSSQLLVASSSFAEDIYRGFLRREKAGEKELIWVGRATVLAISIIALLLGFRENKTILALVGFAWSGFGATFGPAIIYSLFWKRTTRNGIVAGMVVGGITVLLWKYMPQSLAISQLFDIIPGFILSTIVIPVVSMLDKPPAKEIQEEFDEMRTRVGKRS